MQSSKNDDPGIVAVVLGVTFFLAILVALAGALSAFLWNDWGLNFSADFHAPDLTLKQAALVGAMVTLVRLRGTQVTLVRLRGNQ